MTALLSHKDLPRKRMGAGVLLLNEAGEILFVKPTYRDSWLMPGGIVEADESPRQAALREAREEIGLELTDCSLLCVDYVAAKDAKTEALQFTFFGGILNQATVGRIKLQKEELSEFRFVKPENALALVAGHLNLARRLPHVLEAYGTGIPVYLENGVPNHKPTPRPRPNTP